jgi:hypothetical protein
MVRANLEQLSGDIDRAAQSIIGDDTQALRLARAELDELLGDLEGEITSGPICFRKIRRIRRIGQIGPDRTDQLRGKLIRVKGKGRGWTGSGQGQGQGGERPMFYELAPAPEAGGGGDARQAL